MRLKKFGKGTKKIGNLFVHKRVDFPSGHQLWVTSTASHPTDLEASVQLTSDEQDQYTSFHAEKRQCEFLSVRYLLQQWLGPDALLAYDPLGKPYLPQERWNISISHSVGMQAVIVHPSYEVGIDLQAPTEKIFRIRDRFLADMEKEVCGQDMQKHLVYWCAKEALFKYHAKGNLDFREQLFIEPFSWDEPAEMTGIIRHSSYDERVLLRWEKVGGHTLVYTVNG